MKLLSRLFLALVVLPAMAGAQQSPVDVPATEIATPEVEDAQPIARVSARLAYNTDAGVVVGAGFATDRLFGRDQTLTFNVEAREDAVRFNAKFINDAVFGSSPTFGLRLFHGETRADEVYDFDAQTTRIEPRLSWRIDDSTDVSAVLYLSSSKIENVPADSSILIRQDEGRQDSYALGGEVTHRLPITPGGAMRSGRFNFSAAMGKTSRDHEFFRLSAGAATAYVLSDGDVVVRARVNAGALHAIEHTSSIGDRYMLGQASLRGFAFGGFGPRDLAVAGAPALGGNYFGIARFDAQFPNAFGGEGGSRLTPGVFMDIGSLWGLDDTGGGLTGTDEVDDSARLRASVGLSLRIRTGIGPIQMYVAHPIAEESYDRTEAVGLYYSQTF